eukprot:gnl/TRDRNA2_/TRDRNA2_40556_c0_seq1.p1 gnl/TRDRNA2_/TRDRNA2_40556_c0~~gnl/TRDRNA2_/TRDRNA2_40556_c0_seq1.p1  ORF type:complete len:491 (-),score=81.48 gnl/TRDRNA2_/TRDRNA2_40556_c0_seq1:444-1916(-)
MGGATRDDPPTMCEDETRVPKEPAAACVSKTASTSVLEKRSSSKDMLDVNTGAEAKAHKSAEGYAEAKSPTKADVQPPPNYAIRQPKPGAGLSDVDPAFDIVDMDLHLEPARSVNIGKYYNICKDALDLHVTTSCFTIWKDNKKSNGYAKVIPALPLDEVKDNEEVRIFFFDDNLDFETGGSANSAGICNLRHVETGEFVDFGEGRNGFSREYTARHTTIHWSTEYRNVLVKANVLDAMADKNYFVNIIQRFAMPGEKIIAFMDVNSTIVCFDSMQGQDMAAVLLSTMFEFIEFIPEEAPRELLWENQPPVALKERTTLKQLVKKVAVQKHEYSAFWSPDNCSTFLSSLFHLGHLFWGTDKRQLNSRDAFNDMFTEYFTAMMQDVSVDGITSSWFRAYDLLRGRHTVILNSFGVDCRKVILATTPDGEKSVMQIVVNFDMWDDRDARKFVAQFATTDGSTKFSPRRADKVGTEYSNSKNSNTTSAVPCTN